MDINKSMNLASRVKSEVEPTGPFEYKAEYLPDSQVKVEYDQQKIQNMITQVKQEHTFDTHTVDGPESEQQPGIFMYSTPKVMLRYYDNELDVNNVLKRPLDKLKDIQLTRELLDEIKPYTRSENNEEASFDEMEVRTACTGIKIENQTAEQIATGAQSDAKPSDVKVESIFESIVKHENFIQ